MVSVTYFFSSAIKIQTKLILILFHQYYVNVCKLKCILYQTNEQINKLIIIKYILYIYIIRFIMNTRNGEKNK